MFKKLQRKVLILNIAVTTGVLLIAFGAVYLITQTTMSTENQRRLDRVADSPIVITSFQGIGDQIGHPNSPTNMIGDPVTIPGQGQATILYNRAATDTNSSFAVLLDEYGEIVWTEPHSNIPDALCIEAARIAWEKREDSILRLSGQTWMYKIIPTGSGNSTPVGTTQGTPFTSYKIVFLDITTSVNTLSSLLVTLLCVGAGILVLIIFISFFFARRSIRPISEAWEKQKQFVADASHELKTPLTTIMTNYDVLMTNEDSTVKSQQEWLSYMKIGMDRMNRLTHNLLSLAKIENEELHNQKSLFDMSQLIAEVMSSMDTLAQEKNLNVLSAIEPELFITGHKDLTEQALSILFDNAIKYADNEGTVEVRLQRMKKHVVCMVRNTGMGIAKKDLPHIFDRFYRADTVRTSEDNSYGLGLPIAQAIVARLNGSITAASIENEWTEFALMLEI